jgi:hypothetical protein
MGTLEERIAAELHRVLDHQERGGFGAPGAVRGMAIGGPDGSEIVLTVDDVARIAAREAALSPVPIGPIDPKTGHVSTPEGRAWAKKVLAEAKERRERGDFEEIRRWLDDRVRERWGDDVVRRRDETQRAAPQRRLASRAGDVSARVENAAAEGVIAMFSRNYAAANRALDGLSFEELLAIRLAASEFSEEAAKAHARLVPAEDEADDRG